jgi:hypothetical protein
MKIYTGIGSRSTPENIITLIHQVSKKLDEMGFLLRSGGADGADSSFEKFSTRKEIYLPWDGFNGCNHDGESYFDYLQCPGWSIAKASVESFHPAPKSLSNAGRRLMARNAMQISGRDCKSPTDVVICWTKDGNNVGGTSQAIRIAKALNIPILNLGHLKTEQFFRKFVGDTSGTGTLDSLSTQICAILTESFTNNL